MSDESIQRKDLWIGMNNIRQEDWVKAARHLGIAVTYGNGGSHYLSLRDPENLNPEDIKGLVSTVTPHLFKEANRKIFKKVLGYAIAHGMTEDDVWQALGKL